MSTNVPNAPAVPSAIPKRPRKRPLWKKAALALLVLVLVGVGLYVYLRWSAIVDFNNAVAETERDDPHWRFKDILANRKTYDDDKNSALVVIRTVKLLGTGIGSEKWDVRLFDNFPPEAQLNDEQFAVLTDALSRAPLAVAEARTLKEFPEGRFDIQYPPDYITGTMKHIQDARRVFELLNYDVYLRAHSLDGDGALDSCLALLHASRAISDEPVLIAFLVRVAGQHIFVGSLERALAQGEPGEARLAVLQKSIEEELAASLLLQAVRGERGGMQQLMDEIAAGNFDVKGIGMMAGPGINGLEAKMIEMYPGYVVNQRTALLRYMNDMVDACKAPPHEQLNRVKKVEADIKSKPFLVRLLTPAMQKVTEANRRTHANLQCARIALAAERYRLLNKTFPKGPEDLIQAKLIDAMPIDPFDGKTLRWINFADGLLIYSVSRDGIDNQGAGRQNHWQEGSDLGFRIWSPEARRQAPLPRLPKLEEAP